MGEFIECTRQPADQKEQAEGEANNHCLDTKDYAAGTFSHGSLTQVAVWQFTTFAVGRLGFHPQEGVVPSAPVAFLPGGHALDDISSHRQTPWALLDDILAVAIFLFDKNGGHQLAITK